MATASVNVIFGFSSSLVWFCVLWAINGTLQVRSHPLGNCAIFELHITRLCMCCSEASSSV